MAKTSWNVAQSTLTSAFILIRFISVAEHSDNRNEQAKTESGPGRMENKGDDTVHKSTAEHG